MSRLEVKTPSQAQAVVEQLYRNMEGRIAASPPGLCPVDMALNFLNLCQAQTCGKCVPCRIGLSQISDMIREVLDGEPDIGILRRIENTAQVIVNISCITAAWVVWRTPCPVSRCVPPAWTSPVTSLW